MSSYPPVKIYPLDPDSCSLLGPTALLVQALMGVLVLLSLLFKRHRERPKRKWHIWTFDVSKQVVGQAGVHGANIVISWMGASREDQNACAWYVVNIVVDTSLGVGLIYGYLLVVNHLLIDRLHLSGFTSGEYGEPPSWWLWARQLVVYLSALTFMKCVVLGLFALFPALLAVGEWFLEWTEGNKALQVVIVMGIVPIVMNILQFWLIDSIVKSKVLGFAPAPAPMPEDPSDREPLMPPEDPPSTVSSPRIQPHKIVGDLEAQMPTANGKDVDDGWTSRQPRSSGSSGSTIRPPPRREESFHMAPVSRPSSTRAPSKHSRSPSRTRASQDTNWGWDTDEWADDGTDAPVGALGSGPSPVPAVGS